MFIQMKEKLSKKYNDLKQYELASKKGYPCFTLNYFSISKCNDGYYYDYDHNDGNGSIS